MNFDPQLTFELNVEPLDKEHTLLFLKLGNEIKCIQTKMTEWISSSVAGMSMPIIRKPKKI